MGSSGFQLDVVGLLFLWWTSVPGICALSLPSCSVNPGRSSLPSVRAIVFAVCVVRRFSHLDKIMVAGRLLAFAPGPSAGHEPQGHGAHGQAVLQPGAAVARWR